MLRDDTLLRKAAIAQVKESGDTMNSRNLEQARMFKRYLLERADGSRSRLMRDQIRRWVERLDAASFNMRDKDQKATGQIPYLKAA